MWYGQGLEVWEPVAPELEFWLPHLQLWNIGHVVLAMNKALSKTFGLCILSSLPLSQTLEKARTLGGIILSPGLRCQLVGGRKSSWGKQRERKGRRMVSEVWVC